MQVLGNPLLLRARLVLQIVAQGVGQTLGLPLCLFRDALGFILGDAGDMLPGLGTFLADLAGFALGRLRRRASSLAWLPG